MRRAAMIAATATAATMLASCGGNYETDSAEAESAESSGTSAAPSSAPTKKKKTVVKLRESQYGPVLFDGKGGALYLFTADKGGKSACYDACAEAWPPFYARGSLRGTAGVRSKLLGRTTRSDGRKQVTYAGSPLYYYVHDPRGVIGCHDVFEFGGDWLGVQASGGPAPS